MTRLPPTISGFRPKRIAAASTAGRIAKRPAKISAIAQRLAGIDTPARSRKTSTNTPPMPWARAWMPEWRLSQLTARLRRNAMGPPRVEGERSPAPSGPGGLEQSLAANSLRAHQAEPLQRMAEYPPAAARMQSCYPNPMARAALAMVLALGVAASACGSRETAGLTLS